MSSVVDITTVAGLAWQTMPCEWLVRPNPRAAIGTSMRLGARKADRELRIVTGASASL